MIGMLLSPRRTFGALAAALAGLVLAAGVVPPALSAPSYRTLGQPTTADKTLGSRCPNANARFNFSNDGGFDMYGPAGVAIDPRGRIFVADFGGKRVLTWPDATSLAQCEAADGVIGAGQLAGPEAIAIDAASGAVFVADTLSHTVIGYRLKSGAWKKFVTLGSSGVSGSAFNRFNFPRGIAFDSRGRLFVADDSNNRILIFDPPLQNGASAVDSIYAGSNGGLSSPKAVAIVGDALFVADYFGDRVLRFTGPFKTPDQTYVATGEFRGVGRPVDLTVHPDGSLLVVSQNRPRVSRFQDAAFRPSPVAAPDSEFSNNMGAEPLGVAVRRDGRIFIADYRRYRVLIRDESVRTAPVSPGPAAAALVANLRARAGTTLNRVAIGQQLITYEYGPKSDRNAWYRDWSQMKRQGLPLPLMMGGELSDLMSYPGFFPNADARKEMIRHGQAGGLVTLVWHPDNPVAGAPFSTPLPTARLVDMINPATAVGQAWRTQLDRAAAALKPFDDKGLAVLFRPLHEQNGDFFWWGDDGSAGDARRARQAAWVAVWRDMVGYMTATKGLKRLVFAFGTNQVNYDGVVAPMTYYPGADFVDVVSIDVYDEQLDLAGGDRGLQHYAALVGSGKPFGLSEFGQSFGDNGTGADGADWDCRTLVQRLGDSYPRAVFANAWYTTEGNPRFVFALPDVAHTAETLADPLIDTQ